MAGRQFLFFGHVRREKGLKKNYAWFNKWKEGKGMAKTKRLDSPLQRVKWYEVECEAELVSLASNKEAYRIMAAKVCEDKHPAEEDIPNWKSITMSSLCWNVDDAESTNKIYIAHHHLCSKLNLWCRITDRLFFQSHILYTGDQTVVDTDDVVRTMMLYIM